MPGMEDLPFVDTHFHLYDLKNPKLRYSWLEPDAIHPLLGDVEALKAQHYWVENYISEIRFSNVPKAIHVQAALGIPDPVEETAWLQAFADDCGYPHGIVAECHLAQPDAQSVLERHSAFANMRGVRDLVEGEMLDNSAWKSGFSHLSRFDYVCCIDTTFEYYPHVKALASQYPDTPIVLDHCGYPHNDFEGYFDAWRTALMDLAEVDNVHIKISGIGMFVPLLQQRPQQFWTLEGIRPWVLACIEAFTPSRVVFGTNWPVDRMYSSYPDIVNAYRTILDAFSEEEALAMFSTNAERLFRI
jgi:predicted TIM-barrel fold metal-dependent hydrolase